MNKKTIITVVIASLIIIFLVVVFGFFGLMLLLRADRPTPPIPAPNPPEVNSSSFIQFTSTEDFQSYLVANQNLNQNIYSSGLGMGDMMVKNDIQESTSAPSTPSTTTALAPDRYSQTNVQVQGIDEPDIVKTNGSEIFFSPESFYYNYDFVSPLADSAKSIMPPVDQNITAIISAFPPAEMSKLSDIKQNGQLLLVGDNLIVISYDTIYAYNVANPANPTELWQYALSDYNSTFSQSRAFQDKLYIMTQTNLYSSPACPIPLLKGAKADFSVACDQIYHPTLPVTSNVTNTVMQIDPKTGAIEKNISMIGSYDSSTIYMSENNIYATYTMSGDMVSFFHNFILENSSFFSDTVVAKVTKLNSYDISTSSKMLELQTIINQYLAGLNQDDKLKLENDLQNIVGEYLKIHKRELESTMVNQIDLDSFALTATGSVPGTLFNSFSMDEYNDNLRIATTTANNIWGLPINIPNSESVNDVYVLDQNLQQKGSVLDMGAGERIYSVRFVGDRGYVVTFRETDPFYILDLSSASNPQKVGELKIPGYSSYLHPISENLILGVGKEGENVKLSLFDVSSPSDPTEVAKYNLNEYWSDVLSTHHAFLLDDKHQVFFIPGSTGGYVFSYAQNKLELVKAVDSINAQRAIYINDNMYIIGQDKIVVLDEKSWERIKEFSLK